MTWNGRPRRANTVPSGATQGDRIEEAIATLEQAVDADGDALFLWTGGKDAQVIADLLVHEVGDTVGRSPVPFGIIDTGNHFPEMYDFRADYVAASGDQGADTVGPFGGIDRVITERHDELLDGVIQEPADPRGYHGHWDPDGWTCPDCGADLLAVTTEDDFECPDCSFSHVVPQAGRTAMNPDDWDVVASCGALKVVPIRKFIQDHGFDVLITGRRGDDTVVQGEQGGVDRHERKRQPARHERYNPLANWEEANVWAYLKAESVSYPVLYDQGYRHTDAQCCTTKDDRGEGPAGEYGEGGVDPQKEQARDRLQDMGYI